LTLPMVQHIIMLIMLARIGLVHLLKQCVLMHIVFIDGSSKNGYETRTRGYGLRSYHGK